MSYKTDLEIITHFDHHQTNFSVMLLKLFFKADKHNFELLRKGFPNAARMVEHYLHTGEILDLEYD